MLETSTFRLVLVAAPNMTVGRELTALVLNERLAACVNMVPGIESHYWWNGKIESSEEVILCIKTTAAKTAALEEAIIEKHPYDTPEFLVLPIQAGNLRYLDWIERSVHHGKS